MNVFNEAVRIAHDEMAWVIKQAFDNSGSEEAMAVYRKFATFYARDPFLLAQRVEQEDIRNTLLNPENLADAKMLFEMSINLRSAVEGVEEGGWEKVGATIDQTLSMLTSTELLSEDVVDRMEINICENLVFQTMALLYYAARLYNVALTSGGQSVETKSERNN